MGTDKAKVILFSALFYLWIVTPGWAIVKFGVSYTEAHLPVKAGETKSGELSVINQGDEEVSIKCLVEDWAYGKDAQGKRIVSYKPAGTHPYSCSKWLLINPAEFNLKPGESRKVSYLLSVPKEAAGSHYAAIVVQALGPAPLEEAPRETPTVKIRIGGELPIHITHDTAGRLKRKGNIVDMKVQRPDDNKPLLLDYKFKNEGDAYIRLKGSFSIIDRAGRVYAREDLKALNAQQGDIVEGKAQWLGKLPQGEYDLVATFELGPEPAKVIVKEVKIKVEKKGELGEIAAVRENGDVRITVKFHNPGNITLSADGIVDLLDIKGRKVKTAALEKAIVSPDTLKEFVIIMKDFPLGQYLAEVTLYFDGETKRGKATFLLE